MKNTSHVPSIKSLQSSPKPSFRCTKVRIERRHERNQMLKVQLCYSVPECKAGPSNHLDHSKPNNDLPNRKKANTNNSQLATLKHLYSLQGEKDVHFARSSRVRHSVSLSHWQSVCVSPVNSNLIICFQNFRDLNFFILQIVNEFPRPKNIDCLNTFILVVLVNKPSEDY